MITKKYKIADVSFEVSSYYEYVHKESESYTLASLVPGSTYTVEYNTYAI